MQAIKQKAANVLNTAYNKTIYSAAAGASVDFIFGLLSEFHIDVSPGLQTKTLILVMALITLLVKNKNGSSSEITEESTNGGGQ